MCRQESALRGLSWDADHDLLVYGDHHTAVCLKRVACRGWVPVGPQVMLFRLRHHQSYAVVFSFLSTMYSLYEYAAQGIPYRRERYHRVCVFVCVFLF